MNIEHCADRDAMVASCSADDPDFAKTVVQKALSTILEGEMTHLRAGQVGTDDTSLQKKLDTTDAESRTP